MDTKAHEDLRTAVEAIFPRARGWLEELTRVPSVSADGFDAGEVRRSAETVRSLFEAQGLEGARLLEVAGAHPAVFAERRVAADAPTVLLYGHHDVQPAGDESLWESPPFEPTERDGRLYGRGVSDDKAAVAVHLAALAALGDDLAVNVKLFVEGEEEIGSLHLPAFLSAHGETLAADTIVVTDSSNWRVGEPAVTTTLRGLVDCDVEVRTLAAGVHSGIFGGAAPDALMVMSRLLASLHDEAGRPAVAGLASAEGEGPELSEAELRSQAGVLPEVELIGVGALTSRTWRQPAISILALDAPRMSEAINQIVPVARAKVSVRLAPGDDPARAMEALARHLESHAPWGARVKVTRGASAMPFALPTGGSAYTAFTAGCEVAWGRAPLSIGVGGSIPFVAAFAGAFPRAELLLTAVGDPTSRIHGPNESQDLGDLQAACVAEGVMLRVLGGGG